MDIPVEKSVDIVVRQFRAEDLPQDIEGTYIVPGGNFWVATPKTEPTEVVDMVGLELKSNKEGELRRLSVKSTHRRFGVGRKIIAALEQWARANGLHKVWLTTAGVMDKARAFYPSVGYEQTAITVVSKDPYFEVYTFEKVIGISVPLRDNVHTEATSSPSEDIIVRQYRAEDWEQVVTLFRNGMMHYPAHKMNADVLVQHMTEAITTGDLSRIESTYIIPGGNFWVATPRSKPTKVVGMVALEAQDDNVGELRRMSVKTSYRRRGVGCQLIKELEDWARDHGYRKIWLSTGAVMDKARAFYASMEYAQTETIVFNEDPHIEGILFEKELCNAALA